MIKLIVPLNSSVFTVSDPTTHETTIDIPSHLPEPIFELPLDLLNDRTDYKVCQIVVENHEGLYSRFFVTARKNNQGRIVLEVTARANTRDDDGIVTDRDVSKSVTASWRG